MWEEREGRLWRPLGNTVTFLSMLTSIVSSVHFFIHYTQLRIFCAPRHSWGPQRLEASVLPSLVLMDWK